MQLCISFGDDQAKMNEPKSCFLMVQSYNKVEGHEGKKRLVILYIKVVY